MTTSCRLQEAVYFGTKLGMEYMDKDRGRGGGVIINIGSMAGRHAILSTKTSAALGLLKMILTVYTFFVLVLCLD